jgi:hypothetical protein
MKIFLLIPILALASCVTVPVATNGPSYTDTMRDYKAYLGDSNRSSRYGTSYR